MDPFLWCAWVESFFSKFPHEVVEHTCDRLHGVRKCNCFGCVLAVLLYQFYQPIQLLRRLHLFGLTNNWMGSFMVRSSITALSVSLSEVPVTAKTGVPSGNKIHQMLVHWLQFTEIKRHRESTPTPFAPPTCFFDNKVTPTVHQPQNDF